mgnify:CR=1 FL=1
MLIESLSSIMTKQKNKSSKRIIKKTLKNAKNSLGNKTFHEIQFYAILREHLSIFGFFRKSNPQI